MKKNNKYSAQYKIIQPHSFAHQNHAGAFAGAFTASHSNPNPNPQSSAQSFTNKNTLSKDRQEFINNISASGFKLF